MSEIARDMVGDTQIQQELDQEERQRNAQLSADIRAMFQAILAAQATAGVIQPTMDDVAESNKKVARQTATDSRVGKVNARNDSAQEALSAKRKAAYSQEDARVAQREAQLKQELINLKTESAARKAAIDREYVEDYEEIEANRERELACDPELPF